MKKMHLLVRKKRVMEILIPFGTNSNQTNLSPKILMMLLIPTITPR